MSGRRSRYWCGPGIGHWRSGWVTLSEDKSTSTTAFHVRETKLAAVRRFTGQWSAPTFVAPAVSAAGVLFQRKDLPVRGTGPSSAYDSPKGPKPQPHPRAKLLSVGLPRRIPDYRGRKPWPMTGANLRQHQIQVNGESLSADGLPIQTTLLDFLRDHGLTGAKEGCAEGECGACTVLMVSANGPTRSAYKPINSCLMFLPSAVDREFYTVESLARNGKLAGRELTEVQQAMAAGGGSQCGYCTPGFVMSLFAEQYRPGRQGPCDPHAMGGNLCRCTGYRPIRDAALSIGPPPEGFFRDRLSKRRAVSEHRSSPQELRPAHQSRRMPRHRLAPSRSQMGLRRNRSRRRIESEIPPLAASDQRGRRSRTAGIFRRTESRAHRGRAAAQRDRAPVDRRALRCRRAFAELGSFIRLAAHPQPRHARRQSRHRISHRGLRPAAHGARRLPQPRQHSRQPNPSAVVLLHRLPPNPARRSGTHPVNRNNEAISRLHPLLKASKRRMDDISTVAAGLSMDWDPSGRIARAIFAFGGVAPAPLRVFTAEEAALGQPWNEATVERIQRELDRALRPIDDHRGSAAYRLALAKSLVEKFYWEWRVGHELRGQIDSARKRRRPRLRRGALYRRSLRPFPRPVARLAGNSPSRTRPRLTHLQPTASRGMILTADDVPGENDTGSNATRRTPVSR